MTAEALEDAKRALTTEGLALQTIIHYLKFMRHALYATIGKEHLHPNPFAKFKLPKTPKGRLRFLSVEEEDRLYAAIGTRYAAWVRLAILTGLRREEQFSLRWPDVDLELGIVTLPATKSGDVQYLPLTDEAKTILRSMESWQRSGWVFPSENPAAHLDARNFYRRIFLPAVKAAKLEDVTWHTLRHTFASRLAMIGQDPITIAELLRHSGTGLVKRYAHLAPDHLKRAVEGVAAFGKEKTRVSTTAALQPGREPEISSAANERVDTNH